MVMTGDNTCVTSLRPTFKAVACGKQKPYWLELQFVDENNQPVSGLKVQLEYHPLATAAELALWARGGHTRFDPTPPPNPPAGVTDIQGLVRFDDLYWIAVDVKTDGQQLADIMEQRPLGLRRNPNSQPVSGNAFRRETRDKTWRSDVQEKAEAAGYHHHYVTIGELCDRLPDMPGWDAPEPPAFHFPPGKALKGTEIMRDALEQRHVIEICPFRAWVLPLHDTKEYDLANALNLGIMADLAYAEEFLPDKDTHLISYFFEQKCQDLSCLPQFAEFPNYFHTLAVDVPFRERYLKPTYLNTAHPGRDENPEGDSRLFTVECGAHVLVAWCGTASGLNVGTDFSFAPKRCPADLGGMGDVHGGFLEAYQLAKRKFGDKLSGVQESLAKGGKKLFVCGHSLGGALALLYAAEMKVFNPVLYTYGMPRTFSRLAGHLLRDITHYRHVNDNDLVPQIPPEVDMDSELYEKLGWLGDKLGFDWLATSAIGLLPRTFGGNAGVDMGITQERDPYWHHGKTVLFLRAEQSVMKSGERNTLWIGGGTVSYTEKAAVKRYLVPSLNEECLKSTGEHQAAFIQCLAPGELVKRFPQRENVASAGLFTKPLNHFMASKYLPYIHNQVLELADPARDMERKAMRTLFREAVEQKANFSNPDEVERNREFLALQDMLRFTLSRLQTEETGKNALLRFAAVTEEEVELPN
ncbi:lipase family protein [Salmonella enterica]|nr:lipase family protein [Salmonella enterica]EJU7780430.1 lipase family protein [Salmonella enterica subsp. arizonae serovar 56:z36:-]EBM5602523.1 lipase family protein [Salmonella enterica]EBN1283356.1 lipase family protein [Salmonella enterica]EBR6996329.1 lipase family protein [Salmonella enterica]